MSRPVGVVFDLDGVLVDSEHLWEQGWSAFAAASGREWTEADTAACQGKSTPEWAAHLAELTSRPAPDAAREVIASVIAAHETGQAPLMPGARRLVESVAARVPVALASSAPRALIDVVMQRTGLGALFGATVSSAEVARGKPDPDVYREAVRRLGIDAAGSHAVEDSSNGVRAAAAAGLGVIAVPTPRYPLDADARQRALRVVADRDGVLAVLLSLLDPGGPPAHAVGSTAPIPRTAGGGPNADGG